MAGIESSIVERAAPPLRRADWFVELRPFYQLCWVNWALAAAVLVMIVGNSFAPRNTLDTADAKLRVVPTSLIVADASAALVVAGVLATFGSRARRKDRDLEQDARTHTTGRLRKRLDAWRAQLDAILPHEARAEFAVAPGSASVMWTHRARASRKGAPEREPLVLLTPSFWSEDQPEAELTAAFAHEAGHVAAADVETFKRLWWCSLALGSVAPLLYVVPLARVLLAGGGARIPSFWNFQLAGAIGILAVVASWSALLCAREIQADAYAVDIMGNAAPMRAFLARRAEQRGGETLTLAGRAWRWLVQPDLAWRATLPALAGDLGTRVEACLGFALGATVVNTGWTAALLSILPHAKVPAAVFLLVGLGYVTWLAFQFSWWRANAAARARQRTTSLLGAWVRFTTPATVLALLVLLVIQSGPHGNLDGHDGHGVVVGSTFLVLLGFQATTMTVVLLGNLAHGIDALRGRRRPTVAAERQPHLPDGDNYIAPSR